MQTVEILLLVVAVACLTAFGLLQLEQYRGQAELREQFESARAAASERKKDAPARLPGETEEGEPTEEPDLSGEPLGRLTNERIGLDVMVAEGVDHATLRRAAGRIPGTARLDSDGNIGLAAHRDTFFRPLQDIEKGDILTMETPRGLHKYEVEWMAVVEPDNVRFLAESSSPELTLVTCFPFHYVGPAPRRFIVRAKRIEQLAASPAR